ncbi:unnamed protein product [Arctia plantaginis]|uniref:Uncharacterized protein n=1 Tax=Arctia plantaginis TaxID=874455 RepID=A0A8S1AZC6_ARCPL|nr:unnamed protein product [Arctia plantaginis]
MLSSSIVYIILVLQKCFRFASKRFSCCACVGTSTPCWLRPPFTHGAVHTLPQLIQEAVRPDAEIYKKEIQFLCLRWESALCWIQEAVRPDAEMKEQPNFTVALFIQVTIQYKIRHPKREGAGPISDSH